MAPLNEVVSTRPSCSSRVSASRIGVLLTPSCSASVASRSGSPGASLRSTMADFSSSYTQSVTFRRSCRPLNTDTGWVFPSSRERMAMTTTSQPSDHLCAGRPGRWRLDEFQQEPGTRRRVNKGDPCSHASGPGCFIHHAYAPGAQIGHRFVDVRHFESGVMQPRPTAAHKALDHPGTGCFQQLKVRLPGRNHTLDEARRAPLRGRTAGQAGRSARRARRLPRVRRPHGAGG